jgi:hypothetical protein
MAAPEGNQFWKLRSKHGRDKLFASPELLWDAACEYFEWCEEHPFYETKAMTVSAGMNAGSSIELQEIPVKRPFTLHGLCLYLDCGTAYFRQFKSTESQDFSTVLGKIEEAIYDQKFSGAAAGFFNANIIARDLGLSDKSELKHYIPKGILNIDPLADDTGHYGDSQNSQA